MSETAPTAMTMRTRPTIWDAPSIWSRNIHAVTAAATGADHLAVRRIDHRPGVTIAHDDFFLAVAIEDATRVFAASIPITPERLLRLRIEEGGS